MNPSNSMARVGIPKATGDKILGTLRNQLGAAEGSLLPPPQAGSGRVPVVTALRVLQSTLTSGGTQFIIAFNTPSTSQSQIDHYQVYVSGLTGNTQQFNSVASSQSSPVTVTVNTANTQVITFKVQTVLKSGLASTLDNSPSCTSRTQTTPGSGVTVGVTLASLGTSTGFLQITNGVITSVIPPS
jgi:hypothetical protein